MKKILSLSITITILLIIGYKAFISKSLLKERPFSTPQPSEIIDRAKDLPQRVKKLVKNKEKKQVTGKISAKDEKEHPAVVLYFKDGSAMEGELISETDGKYIVNWKGSEVVVYSDQIERLDRDGASLKAKSIISEEEMFERWPYKNDIVVKLTNGVVLDAKINKVSSDELAVLYSLEAGGFIEQDIKRSRIEHLIFRPIHNAKSEEIEASLKELFPRMKFYKEGGFTLVTDSYITWAKKYISVLKGQYTDIYLKFFRIFKDRSPQIQNFIVIFDEYPDYMEYAITDGVPGWMAAGYFSPIGKVLYLYNMLGDSFSEFIFEAFVGETGETIDNIADNIKGRTNERYHVFIDGQAKVIKDKYWQAYSYYKAMYRDETMNTLRHEFAHELFYNWGLQSIILSTIERDKEGLIKKKKEFLEAKDLKKKAELAKKLLTIRGKEKMPDIKAANSWLSEGIATYCETYPLGAQNNRWLYYYQDMAKKGPVYPIESMTYYKMGSFPGVYSEAMLHLYAQSWAFVSFLMEKYPSEFMEYQDRMAKEKAAGHEDIGWLLEAVGKDLKTLQVEFEEYMNTYKNVDDPDVANFVKFYNIFKY